MQIKLGEVWTCGSWDEHANRQTHVMCIQTWLTGTSHSSQYSASILGQTNNHSNILLYCIISTVISSNLINNYSFKLQFNHIIFYHLESFYCSLHCGKQPHSRQKKLHLTKSGGSEAGKPWTLKSGGGLEHIGALQKFTPMPTTTDVECSEEITMVLSRQRAIS